MTPEQLARLEARLITQWSEILALRAEVQANRDLLIELLVRDRCPPGELPAAIQRWHDLWNRRSKELMERLQTDAAQTHSVALAKSLQALPPPDHTTN